MSHYPGVAERPQQLRDVPIDAAARQWPGRSVTRQLPGNSYLFSCMLFMYYKAGRTANYTLVLLKILKEDLTNIVLAL